MDISTLLDHAAENNASDIHAVSGQRPIFRVHGELLHLRVPNLTDNQIKELLHSIMSEKQRADFEANFELDFALQFKEKRYRVNAFQTISGPAFVMRVIPTDIKTISELGAPEVLLDFCNLSKGLVLVTGPTGSGKTTTVAAMLHHINMNQSKHILTIEDPIEYVHKSHKSLVNQREIGSHSASFARALKSALREDPDVILVGELRDLETIQSALTAAETGHLVIATLHTNSAPQTIDRIIDVFPHQDKDMIRTMLSTSIEAIVSQKLIKKRDALGRVCAYEVMIANSAIRNLMREGKIHQLASQIQISSKAGMISMRDSVQKLQDMQLISQEAARLALNIADIGENKISNLKTGEF